MKFTGSLLAAVSLAASAFAAGTNVSVSFDQVYDGANNSLATVACSDGANGLLTRTNFTTFGQLPTFPFIGGATAIAGWNSTACGTCWTLAFNGTTITVLAIDHADGFNIGLNAMNNLTHGTAVQVGRVTAVATQVNGSACGLF